MTPSDVKAMREVTEVGRNGLEARVVVALYWWAAEREATRALTVAVAQWLVLVVPLVLLAAWWWPAAGRYARRHVLVACGVSLALTGLAALPLTHLIDRARPFVALGLTPLFAHGVDSSFPSDHTLVGVSLAAPLVWRLWRLGVPLLIIALLTGLARVVVGIHWPSDIIGSALVALGLGGLALPLTRVALAWLPTGLGRWLGLGNPEPSPVR